MRLRPSLSVVALAALLSLGSTGCYSYVPVDEGPVDAGEDVRVTVAASDDDSVVYTGRLQRMERDTFVLQLPVARTPGQVTTARERQRVVRLSADRVQRVERQSFSFWRTIGLVGGGGLAGYVALAELAGSTENREPGGGDEDSGEFVVIPLLRIP